MFHFALRSLRGDTVCVIFTNGEFAPAGVPALAGVFLAGVLALLAGVRAFTLAGATDVRAACSAA